MKFQSFLKRNLPLVLCVLGLLAFRWSFADQYRVPTGSMIPTVHIGDHIFVNKMAYDLKIPFSETSFVRVAEPERGDVVVFLYPKDDRTVFLKRMIGLPGDHIVIKDGFISVNGLMVEGSDQGMRLLESETIDFSYREKWGDKFATIQRIPRYSQRQFFDFVVPEDMYFCMGDNRDNSDDGRSWGFVPRKNLKGKALMVLWSVTFDQLLPQLDWRRSTKLLL